jgi:hypothetical protein
MLMRWPKILEQARVPKGIAVIDTNPVGLLAEKRELDRASPHFGLIE